MKFKYLYITGIVAALNIFNTSMALADITPGPEVAICPIICIFAITSISIRIGISGLKYVKGQINQRNNTNTIDNKPL